MEHRKPTIYEMLGTLTLAEKKELLEHLQAEIEAAATGPEKTYLEEQWIEIRRLIEVLRFQPYIEDPSSVDDIWQICDELIESGRLPEEPWDVRRSIIESIVREDCYAEVGAQKPMKALFRALMHSTPEKLEAAGIIDECGGKNMQLEAAELYQECGQMGKSYASVNRHYTK